MKYFGALLPSFVLLAILSSPLVAQPDAKEPAATKSDEKMEPAPAKAEDQPVAKRSDDQLLADLDSGDPARQSAACRELGQRKLERAGGDLVAMLTKGTTAEVRRNAAAALGLIRKGGLTTDALLKAAREDKDATVRYGALAALANIQDKDKADETIKVMQWTRDSSDDEFAKDLVTKLLVRLEKAPKSETKEEQKSPAKDDGGKKASS